VVGGGKFEPWTLALGPQAKTNITRSSGTEVASGSSSGQFMLDSESQLREAVQKMLEQDLPKTTATPTAAAGSRQGRLWVVTVRLWERE